MIYKGATLCDINGMRKGDIEVKDGIIARVESAIESTDSANIVDCKGKILTPQFIDFNVFPKNKSLSRKSLASLADKAKRGGVGGIVLQSDTSPAIDSEMAIEFVKGVSKDLKFQILPLIASLNSDEKICDISILHALGGIGISTQSAHSPNTLDKVAKYAKMLDIPLFITADDNLGGIINYGAIAANLGLPAKNPLSEIKEVAKMLEIAIFYDIKAIFSAIVEPRSVELINEAKRHNERIFCETPIHHLILNDEACVGYNTAAKLNPPLKDEKARESLRESLQNGKIDLLTSLQCASFNSKKEQVFAEAAFGIDAIMCYFPLIWTHFIKSNLVNLEQISRICAKNPATILRLNCGEIAPNKEARLMIIDAESTSVVDDTSLPYYGWNLAGKVDGFIV